MSKEIPLQTDMFSGEMVDNRSRTQKYRNREDNRLKQIPMFSARETIQFGVNARPWLNDMVRPVLMLETQDVRTEEEKERDHRLLAESLTAPMFIDEQVVNGADKAEKAYLEPTPEPVASPPCSVPSLRQVGFRAYTRRASIPVRWNGKP